MKTLYFLRHAKSDWSNIGLSDQDRPLNSRGRRACVKIGIVLQKRGFNPGLVLCSSAVRARETLDRVMSAAGNNWPKQIEPDLYGASADRILGLIRQQSDEHDSLLCVGHNPGFQDIVIGLSGKESYDGLIARVNRKLPTAAFAELRFEVDHFRDIGVNTGCLVDFFKPKDKMLEEKTIV